MIFYYLGMAIMVWLFVGLIMGLKFIYFDGHYEQRVEETLDELRNQDNDDAFEIFEILFSKKINILIIFSLTGFIPFLLDIYFTFFNR